MTHSPQPILKSTPLLIFYPLSLSMYLIPDLSKVSVLSRRSNYAEWSLETQGVTMISSFWDTFTSKNNTLLYNPQINAATKCACNIVEQKGHSLIIKTISQVLCQEITNYRVITTAATASTPAVTCTARAKDLWKYLETKYKKKVGISALLNFQLLIQAKLTDNGTLEAQLNKFTELWNNTTTSGYTFKDWQFTSLMLITLPQSFLHIKDSFLTMAEPSKLDPSAIHTCILECKTHHTNNPSANLLTTKKSTSRGGNQQKGKVKQCPPKLPPNAKPCWHCGKKGHWAANCMAKPTNNQNATSPSNQKDEDKGPNLNIVTTNIATTSSDWSLYLFAFGSPENWLFDTGASNHMTPFGSDFIQGSYTVLMDSALAVTLGDNTTKLIILGNGSVERWHLASL